VLKVYAIVYAGVIDQSFDAAKLDYRFFYRTLALFWKAQFGFDGKALSTLGFNRFQGFKVVALVAAYDYRNRSLTGQYLTNPFANAFGTTRYDDDFVF
jgi:hypothetical protein